MIPGKNRAPTLGKFTQGPLTLAVLLREASKSWSLQAWLLFSLFTPSSFHIMLDCKLLGGNYNRLIDFSIYKVSLKSNSVSGDFMSVFMQLPWQEYKMASPSLLSGMFLAFSFSPTFS